MPPTCFESVRLLSFALLSRISEESGQEPSLRLFRKKIISSTPKPCLVPVTSPFARAGDAKTAEVNVRESQSSTARCDHMAVDYSPCGRYLVARAKSDVIVLDAHTKESMKRLSFHKRKAYIVKFASSSKILSVARDNTIAVWNWESDSTPSILFRDHDDVVSAIGISCDGASVFSASKDGMLKAWSLTGGEAIENCRQDGGVSCMAVHEDKVAIVSDCMRSLRVLELDRAGDGQRTLYADEIPVCRTISFSKNGLYLATASNRRVRVLRTDS